MSTPVIAVVSPSESQTITRTVPLILDVTDPNTFRRVVITAVFGGSIIEEVVHDGVDFAPAYTGGVNARAAITDGYRYTILRLGGWRGSSVTLKVIAIDILGNLGSKVVASPHARYAWQLLTDVTDATFIGSKR